MNKKQQNVTNKILPWFGILAVVVVVYVIVSAIGNGSPVGIVDEHFYPEVPTVSICQYQRRLKHGPSFSKLIQS